MSTRSVKSTLQRVAAVVLLLVPLVLVVPMASAGAVSPALTHDEAFVTAAYNDFLGRNPTSQELASATSVSLATPAARADVVSGLSESPEWIQVTVNKLYVDTLGRKGDQGGVNFWVGKIRGVMSVADVAASFYSSSEYFNGFGHSDVRTWILDLYTKILLRDGIQDPTGVSYWVTTTVSQGRHAVAFSFYQSHESRLTRVKGLYHTLLNRLPDQTGGEYWAGLIATRGDLALSANLAESSEYYNDAYTRYGTPATAPGAPTGVVATAGDAKATITWSAPSSNGGSPINGYTVTSSVGGKKCTTTGATSCTVTGLTNGISYTFTVTAKNPAGTSPASAPSTPVTPIAPTSAPSAPTGATAIAGNAKATITWTAPSVNGGSSITGYTVTSSPGSKTCTTTTSALTCTVSGLTNGTSYTFTVTAKNTAGTSPASAPSTQITPVNPAPTSSWAVLPLPGGFANGSAAAVNDSGLAVGAADDAASKTHALAWAGSTHAVSKLPEPSGAMSSEALAVSQTGIIVGDATMPDGTQQPVEWAATTHAVTVLPLVSGFTAAIPRGVNSSGLIVGSTTSDGWVAQLATVWEASVAHRTSFLPSPTGSGSTSATAVNDSGLIVGTVPDNSGFTHAAEWASSIDRTVTTFPMPPNGNGAQPTAINDSGIVVGHATDDASENLSVEWAATGSHAITILPKPSGFSYSPPSAINSNGTAVGTASNGTYNTQVAQWTGTTHVVTQPTLPANDTAATINGLNDAGVFVGSLHDVNNDRQAALFTPSTTPLYVHGTIPSRTVGTALTAAFTAGGGNGPYSLTATGLPTGLTLSAAGVLSGTPTIGGTFQPIIKVTDHSGATATTQPQLIVASGQWSPLPTPASYLSANAGGNNTAGAIVGSGQAGDGAFHAILWDATSHNPTQLPDPTGYNDAGALWIADDGTVVGVAANDVNLNPGTPVIWDAASHTPSLLTLPAGYTTADITGMSSNGSIVGTVYATWNTTAQPVVWDASTHTPLILPVSSELTQGEALGVNSIGTVVGFAYDASFNKQPLEWSSGAGHVETVLPVPAGATGASASGLNGAGLIVGSATMSDGTSEAIKWGSASSHTPTVLTVPSTFTSPVATAINDSGSIIGTATNNGDNFLNSNATGVSWDATPNHTFAAEPVDPHQILTPSAINAAGLVSGTLGNSGAIFSPVPFPVTVSGTFAHGTVGDAFTGSVAGFGGASPLVLSATGLPAGLSMDPDGNVSGIPAATGTATVVVTATDSWGSTATLDLSLTVDANPWTTLLNPPDVTDPVSQGMNHLGTFVVGSGTQGDPNHGGSGTTVAVEWDVAARTAVVLPMPSGATFAEAVAVNDNGVIVGDSYSSVDSSTHVVEWDGSTAHSVTFMSGSAGGTTFDSARPAAISDSGIVVGEASTTNGSSTHYHAVEWDATSSHTAIFLADPAGHSNSIATDINASGQVVGTTDTLSYSIGSLWAAGPDHVPSVLTDPAGFSSPGGMSINDNGLITGTEHQGAYGARGTVWEGTTHVPKTIANVSTPYPYGSISADGVDSVAVEANASGEVAGYAFTGNAVIWSAGSYAATVVALPAGSTSVTVIGFSDAGLIVGESAVSGTNALVVGVP